MEELKLTTKRKEVSVTFTDGEGAGKKFVLRELNGTGRDAFLTELGQKIQFTGGKVSGVSSFEGVQASLIAKCLFDETNKPVPVATIQAYPAGTLSKLFETAQKLNGLDLESAEKLKNK